ncbi:MAG: glycoside hydrolase family 47 protein, partial [Terriglobus roseus]|nr:glycoside hydrolase family 47 protein [Terriglobus roseus]
LLAAVSVVAFYALYATFVDPPQPLGYAPPRRTLQHAQFLRSAPPAQDARAARVRDAARHVFASFKGNAWGDEDIDPLTGKGRGRGGAERNGWGGFAVEASTTLALMGMWDEFQECLAHVLEKVDFQDGGVGTVDPLLAKGRYFGALVSLVDMADDGLISDDLVDRRKRIDLLANLWHIDVRVGHAQWTESKLPVPRVNLSHLQDLPDAQARTRLTVDPAHAATMLLPENAAFGLVASNNRYSSISNEAWPLLVTNESLGDSRGLVPAPINVTSAEPVGNERHWDEGHGFYYDTLLKTSIHTPKDRYTFNYLARWNQSATAVRRSLTSRSLPSDEHLKQHLFLGRLNGSSFVNEQSQSACAAPGTLILGGAHLSLPSFVTLGQALLEACHHVYHTSPIQLGPQAWSWSSMPLSPNDTITPPNTNAKRERSAKGYWIADYRYTFDPSYFASLFYAWRITGEQRYRDWAWEAFVAIDKRCKTKYGFAGLRDISDKSTTLANILDPSVAAADVLLVLRYLWLIFVDVDVGSLDHWVFTTFGGVLRRR